MRAAVYQDVENVEIKDMPMPQIGSKEILLRVRACAICGTDVRIFHHGHPRVMPPRILGHEIAGDIEAFGEAVKGFQVGERVATWPVVPCRKCYWCLRGMHNLCDDGKAISYEFDGGFTEYVKLPKEIILSSGVVRVPEELPYEEASIAEPLGCCINGQELASIRLGETVVVIGDGPAGCMHLQLAKAVNAKVLVLGHHDIRLKKARELGADVIINSKNEDPVKRVFEETNDKGADVVIVATSTSTAQQQSLEMGSKRARIVFFGGLPHAKPTITFNSNIVHYKEQNVMGSFGSTPYQFRKAVELIAQGVIDAKRTVTDLFSLDDILDAFKYAESRKGLKIVIKP